MTTEHKPHSMLEGDFAMVRAAVEGWDHDEPHYTEVIAGYPLCDRCATEAALRRIEEQLEAAQDRLSAPRDVTALRVGIDWHSHDGMVTVYDRDGRYMGCMGVERFHRLLGEDGAISSGPNPAKELK